MFRQCKNRLQCSDKPNINQIFLSIDNELKNIYHTLDKLFNENLLLKAQIDKLEKRHEYWISNEQIYLLKRIEKLENDNLQLREIYQTYHIQNEKCIRSITDLIIKILLTQQNESLRRSTTCILCPVACNTSNNNEHTTNNEFIWSHQQSMIVEDLDQKTTNQSSKLDNYSSTLATIKSKTDKSSTSSTNKLYFVLNNQTTTSEKSTEKNNHHLSNINIVSLDDSPHKQQSSKTLNKNRSKQQQTNTNYSNHERSSIQTSSYRTTKTTTPSISKPSRIPIIKPHPLPTTNNQQHPHVPTNTNQKITSSSQIIHKSSRPLFTSTIPARSFPSVGIIPTIKNKPNIIITKPIINNTKKHISSIVQQQPARVSDIDVLIAEQNKNKNISKLPVKPIIVSPSPIINNIQQSLFSKDTIKRIRTVRSHELKLFSCHLIPEISDKISSQTNESLSTLTPTSLESITDNNNNKSINDQLQNTNKSCSNISTDMRDFSEDSLNEHDHIQRLLKQNTSINTTNIQTDSLNNTIQNENIGKEYFLSIVDNLNPEHNRLSSSSSSIKSRAMSLLRKPFVHRLIFPERLGRMIFYRRILSDSDIYQKNCSKDNEIYHNVYHLDTIRDYSMEFYMLTTYTSDSELRAWIDSNDDIVDSIYHSDENFFQQNNENQIKSIHSQDSLNQQDELHWYSELEIIHPSLNNQQKKHENTSNYSTEVHIEELLHHKESSPSNLPTIISSDSIDLISSSSILPNDTSNKLHSISLPSNITNETNLLLEEIFPALSTHRSSISSTIPQQQTNIDQYENDSTSSIITEEFKHDFYYLCPVTNTTNFSKNDYKPLFHDF
ncbi:unnamed protein product [Rotaria sp. Silwood1]|nr:unnamed protein product [Rotaria sp. Silwood1]